MARHLWPMGPSACYDRPWPCPTTAPVFTFVALAGLIFRLISNPAFEYRGRQFPAARLPLSGAD